MSYQVSAIPNLVARVEDGCAVVVTPFDHARVHRGDVWEYSVTTAAKNDGQTHVLHIVPDAGIDELHFIFAAGGSGAGFARLYEGPTVTLGGEPEAPLNGTEVTPRNRMRITARQQAFASKLYHTPTTSDNGTLLIEAAFGSGKNTDGLHREDEWVLDPSKTYLLILESDSASNVMSADLVLYEKA